MVVDDRTYLLTEWYKHKHPKKTNDRMHKRSILDVTEGIPWPTVTEIWETDLRANSSRPHALHAEKNVRSHLNRLRENPCTVKNVMRYTHLQGKTDAEDSETPNGVKPHFYFLRLVNIFALKSSPLNPTITQATPTQINIIAGILNPRRCRPRPIQNNMTPI